MQVKDKISLLRTTMSEANIDAFIIYSADPHMSEYLPEQWKERTWISGFTGSAGWVVITSEQAGLWTDGRYFTQAESELKSSGIELFKQGIAGTPDYIDWIISQTKENAQIAVHALTCSHENWEQLNKQLTANKRKLIHQPLLKNIWVDRPQKESQAVFIHPDSRAGQSVQQKLENIQSEIKQKGAQAHILSMLDDIAWTLNLRGNDVECNPVFLSYLLILENEKHLFVDPNKITFEVRNHLQKAGVDIQPYDEFFSFLQTISGLKFQLAPNNNQMIFDTLGKNNHILVDKSPVPLMKAVKNEVELAGFHIAMQKDGVAMVNFLHWLMHEGISGSENEFSIGQKLESFRASRENFVGVSFDSIVGYQGNGAIIHYKAPEVGSADVHAEGSILIDSGGQYLEGTTDITRTIPLGQVSEEFKRAYTLVLKGHIQLSMAKFPKGTTGAHLDSLARLALWKDGKDYNHGTGHGVGSFLNVHEGPQNIRKDLNPQELLPGMVVSNEPGYYAVGEYGIRLENLIAVKTWKQTYWNTFYEFETLTFCPFFTSPIMRELLTTEEINWLNSYHQKCEELLAPHLEENVKVWFLELTKAI